MMLVGILVGVCFIWGQCTAFEEMIHYCSVSLWWSCCKKQENLLSALNSLTSRAAPWELGTSELASIPERRDCLLVVFDHVCSRTGVSIM